MTCVLPLGLHGYGFRRGVLGDGGSEAHTGEQPCSQPRRGLSDELERAVEG